MDAILAPCGSQRRESYSARFSTAIIIAAWSMLSRRSAEYVALAVRVSFSRVDRKSSGFHKTPSSVS